MTAERVTGRDVIPLRTAARAWFAISLQTFGGPAGQIAVMQHKLVDELRWIGQRRFLHALNFCMLLPGPEAQQLAIYTGWLLNGIRGGLVAGGLFVLPGMLALLGLSAAYVALEDTDLVTSLFVGLGPAVIAIVVQAVYRVGRRALTHRVLTALAVASFVALTVFAVPFPAVVLTAGAVGWLAGRSVPSMRHPPTVVDSDADAGAAAPLVSDEALHHDRPSWARAARLVAVGVVLWLAPVLAFAVLVTSTDVFVEQGLFFSGTALVTFGGAYAVLAFVAQQAVTTYGWLGPGEMVRGLALAETTPGPLIMVVQFVAFLGAYRDPGSLDPWVAAVLASLLTTWVTFVPCFLLVFVLAPYVERLRGNASLNAALTGVTAAVVGVIASLAVYFAEHVLFRDVRRVTTGPLAIPVPEPASWSWVAAALTALALALVLWRRWSPLRTLGLCAVLGAAAGLAGLAP